MIDQGDLEQLTGALAVGGVALFPADTVYGLACDPNSAEAATRLYALKGRSATKPAAVMFGALELALRALPELGSRTTEALFALTPGPVTLLLNNPSRQFTAACGPDPDTLGIRVPAWPSQLKALGALEQPVMQSSANRSGGVEARRLQDVPLEIRSKVDLELDGGELPGLPSSVIDLRAYETRGAWRLVREGALSRASIEALLA